MRCCERRKLRERIWWVCFICTAACAIADHVYYRWPRSIYRPIYRPLYRSTVDRPSADSRSIVGQQSTDSRSTVSRQSTHISPDSRPIVVSTDTVFDRRYSTDTWPIHDRYTTVTWPIVDRYMTDTSPLLDRRLTDTLATLHQNFTNTSPILGRIIPR